MIVITKCEKKFDHRLGGSHGPLWPPLDPPLHESDKRLNEHRGRSSNQGREAPENWGQSPNRWRISRLSGEGSGKGWAPPQKIFKNLILKSCNLVCSWSKHLSCFTPSSSSSSLFCFLFLLFSSRLILDCPHESSLVHVSLVHLSSTE